MDRGIADQKLSATVDFQGRGAGRLVRNISDQLRCATTELVNEGWVGKKLMEVAKSDYARSCKFIVRSANEIFW